MLPALGPEPTRRSSIHSGVAGHFLHSVAPSAATSTTTLAGAAPASVVVEVTAEEATTWGRDAVDDVAGDGDTPCRLGTERRQHREIE